MPDEKTDNDDSTRRRPRDGIVNILLVSIGLSLVCSILVSVTAVTLKPLQIRNEELKRKEIILSVAGLLETASDNDVEALFGQVQPRVVDLATGKYAEDIDTSKFDAGDSESSIAIPRDRDIANIGKRSRYALVYELRRDGKLEQVILPVHGYGLWSTMYGYISIAGGGRTIRGLRFYEHAETPGLGDQIDDPRWLSLWNGKKTHDLDGTVRIEVIKGAVNANRSGEDAGFQVDGLSGATLTSRGVTNLLRYWLGADGFGPYLENLRHTE